MHINTRVHNIKKWEHVIYTVYNRSSNALFAPVYSNIMCSVVSVTTKSEYELVSDAVLGTDLHLGGEYTAIYIRWLSVEIHTEAPIHCYTSLHSCHPSYHCHYQLHFVWSIFFIIVKVIPTFSSKPSNSQWVFFTGTSYTELIAVDKSSHSFDNPLSLVCIRQWMASRPQSWDLQILFHSQSSSY